MYIKILNQGEGKKGAIKADVGKDVKPAAKALVVSKLIAIFHPRDRKS